MSSSRAENRLALRGGGGAALALAIATVVVAASAGRARSGSRIAPQVHAEVAEPRVAADVPLNVLIQAAKTSDDASARESLAYELRFRPGEAATDAILALLRDEAPEVRLAAAESLEARADRHSLIAIAAHVEDEEDLDVEGALRRAMNRMTAER